MSEGGSQWGGREPGDTCNVVISIPGQARTDPPDKRRSLVDAVTAEGSHSGSLSPQQVERVASPALTPGELQQAETPDSQQRGRRQQQYQITPERQYSLQQVWVPHEVAQQQQQQQQRKSLLQEKGADVSPTLSVTGSGQICDDSYSVWSRLSISKERVDKSDSISNASYSEIKNRSGNVGSRNDGDNLNNTSLSASVSPRLSRYRRQHRVISTDEPPSDVVGSQKDVSVGSLSPSDEEPGYHHFVNGSIQLSSRSSAEGHNDVALSESRDKGLATQGADPAQISHSVITFQKRSSLEHSSVLNLAAGGEDNSLLKKSWSSRKKKKDKRESGAKGKSDLSGSCSSTRGDHEKRENGENQNGDSEVLPQSTSSRKASRRLAKRGISMFPGSNWRRLRNTLKAANEMQSSKKQRHALNREDSFLKKFSTRNHQNVQNATSSLDDETRRSYYSSWRLNGRFVIQHDGNFMFYWLAVVTVSVLYNLWTCIARQAFREIQQGCPACWYSLDAVFDTIYICDILVQFRTGYLDQGLMVYDSKKLRQKYARSKVIYIDFISLLPLDLLQFAIGIHPMIRFPRFFKIYRPLRFLHMLESRTAYPNLIRVANLTHILFLGAHWFAAFYYMISEAEGFKGEWSYPKPVGEFADVNRKYLRSLFWSTLTLTTIGDIPPPGNSNDLRMSNSAYVFVIVSYLIGVFVFATIVGQVGNVINNRNASRQEFERLLDGAKIYMQTHSVPHNLQKRVQRWYDYVWSRGRLNGCDINSLGLLPDKLKTELAIHVNLETLKKVTIFQECQPEFLHDLVLKMKAYIFTPGDLICRRGEVAREMFIIADGVVEIISESGVMLKRMGAGDFFGEIGILNLDGGINRRTADVRSVGYLELFVLSREDVLAALKDHPEAESIIRDYGQRRLREVEAHRQKVKPLKCRGSTEPTGNQVTTPQTVQNRLLQTLRSLNPVVRRQSSQINHVGSPPPVGQTSSPTDMQRCVNPRGSPVKRAVSSLAKASANMQSDLAVVSLDRSDFSTENSSRYSEDFPMRRQSFGYIRTAYARFRNAFNRRRCQRRSVDISEARRRELWENRVLFKSMDEQRDSSDVAGTTVFKPGCNVTLNVEDCSESSKLTTGSVISDNCVIDNEKDKQERTTMSVAVKRGSVLFPGLLDNVETRKYGHTLGRVVQRKYSEPVAYMPVCTEDLDEKFGHCSKDNLHEETDNRSQIILDVAKFNQILERKSSTPKEEDNSEHCTCEDNLNSVTSSTESPGNNIISVDNPSIISSTMTNNDEDHANSCNDPVDNGSLVNANHYENVNPRVNDVVNSNNDVTGTPSPNHSLDSSVTPVKFNNMELESSDGYSQDLPRCQSFSSSSVETKSSPRQRYMNRTPSIRSQGRTLTQTSSESDSSRHHSTCVFHLNATTGDTVVPSSSLLTASPSPFTLSCHCDPADNFKKFISCHLPESLHHKLIKKSLIASSTGILNTSSQRPRNESIPQSTSGHSEVTHRTSTLYPCACSQSGRSFSFPTLAEHREDAQNSGACMPRHPSCQLPEQFLFDEMAACQSPKLAKLKQEDIGAKVTANGFGGRSHAMSIIQQPTSDFSYQQLTAQINIMQGMIDKRLTLLEEAYASATTKLEYLATSQDMLVHLLKQQLTRSQSKESVQAYPADGDDSQAASII